MSYDKNTVNMSAYKIVRQVLCNLNIPYSTHVFCHVAGKGLNDMVGAKYPLRRLQYGNYVLLERMVRSKDCDVDDVISSFDFTVETEPKNWVGEVWWDFDFDMTNEVTILAN